MTKSFISLVFVCVAVLIATAFAANNVEISFKDSNQVFATGLPSIVQIKLTDVEFTTSSGVVFTFVENQDERDARQDEIAAGTWTFQPLTIATTFNSATQHVIGYQDDSKALCVETTTGKPLGQLINIASQSFELIANDQGLGQFTNRFNNADGYGTWTFECPIVFTQQSNAINTFNVRTQYSGKTGSDYESQDDELSLQPARPYFIVPDVEFKSLSLPQNTNEFYSSSKIDFSFATNSTGDFTVSIQNGPWFFAYPTTRDGKPDFWCTAGDNKFRMVYQSTGAVLIVVNVATDSTINCSAFVSEVPSGSPIDKIMVSTKRVIVTISHSDVAVKRAADWVFYPGNVSAELYQSGGTSKTYELVIDLSNLFHSTTPLHVNSTVTFQLSADIDVRTLDIQSSGYEGFRGYNCNSGDLTATVSINASSNTITLSDVLDSDNSYSDISCTFHFSSGAAHIYENDRSLTVVTKIDGRSLRSVESNTENAIVHVSRPYWTPFHPAEENSAGEGYFDCQVDGDNFEFTYRFDFLDDYLSFGYTPINPLLIFGFPTPRSYKFSQDELQNQLRCEATTATRSSFEPIDLAFDQGLMAWTYKLDQVDQVEAYAIKFRCYHTEPVLKKFGLVLNTDPDFPRLRVEYIDLERGNRYFDTVKSLTFASKGNCANKVGQTEPSSSEFPKDAQYRICASAPVVLPSVDDASIASAVAHFKSAFEAAVSAGDTTKSVSLTSWLIRPSSSPSGDVSTTSQIALEQAEQMYEMYHTQIGHDQVVQYRVDGSSSPYPSFPYYEGTSWNFHDQIHKYSISVELCYVVSEADRTTLQNNIGEVKEILWHSELFETADKVHVPISSAGSLANGFNHEHSSSVSGCGFIDGLSIIPDFGTSTYTWANYQTAGRSNRQCLLGESCQMNADCDQNQGSDAFATVVCKATTGAAKTCQFVPRKQSPYVRFNSGTSAEDRSDYAFNSAHSLPLVFAAIISLIALFF